MNTREIAWRVFAMEFNQSKIEIKSEDVYSPSYLLSPLGAQINRLLVVGVLTDVQNVGSDTQPIWRAKITDPTGVFYVSAGKFQPKLAQTLSGLELMSFVAVVGKGRSYSPSAGTVYVSIRPEAIIEVDKETRDAWMIDAAYSLKTRMDFHKEARLLSAPDEKTLLALGVPQYLADGLIQSLTEYDADYLREKYKTTLSSILTDFLHGAALSSGEEAKDKDDQDVLDEQKEQAQEQVMVLLSSLTKETGRVLVDEVKSEGDRIDMDAGDITDALAALMDKGNIYEPELGYIQMV